MVALDEGNDERDLTMAVADYVTLVVGLGVIVLGLLFALTGVQHYFEGRRVTAKEITPIEHLEPGPVSIAGTARPADDGVLPVPFSDRDCLATEYEVREVQGKNKQTPTLIADGVESVPFYVDDGTSQVLIRPDEADLELEKEEKITVAREEQPPEPIQRFLSRREDIDDPKEPTIDVPGSKIGTRYFREQLIEPGEEVYVFGKATRGASAEFGETEVEIREGAAGGHPDPRTFIVSDRPKETVSGGHKSGGLMAFVGGGLLVAIGSAMVLATPLV